MCGFTGFTHERKQRGSAIKASVDTLSHRGPDESNIFQSRHLSLGAVRLKIVDLERGQQPMSTEPGDYVIAFNGEIYNHRELRIELEARGHRFLTDCDTEVVLRAFVEWDTACFPRLHGMFAAALWQEPAKRLVLVRDRLGIKPLYYTSRNSGLFFASELKALFAQPDIPRIISHEALGYYLCLNYVPGPFTLIQDIYKVQPASWLEWSSGRLKSGTYWRPSMCPQQMDFKDAAEKLDALLSRSVREHMTAEVPTGIWLSGGLDSATLLHYAASETAGVNTFSISFRGRDCDESRLQRDLASHYGTRHEELDLNTDLDLTAAIHELSYYSDEPSADAGALPVWFLSKMTAKRVRVALSGEGSDEIFGGYQTYLADRYARTARQFPTALIRAGALCARALPVSDRKIGFEYKLKRFLAGLALPPDEAHFFWNGAFSEVEYNRLGLPFRPPALKQLVNELPALPEADDINRFLFIDQRYYLPDNILYKCDRMSMAYSLEVRPPFLDHRIVEFASRLPQHLKINGSETKVLLRRMMRNKLPRGGFNPRKEGLDIPAHEWLRGPLRELLLDGLSADRVAVAGLFPYSAVARLVRRHLSRAENLGYQLWGLLTLHLWIHRWNVHTALEVPEAAYARAAAAERVG